MVHKNTTNLNDNVGKLKKEMEEIEEESAGLKKAARQIIDRQKIKLTLKKISKI